MGGHGREITDNNTGAIMVNVSQEVITQYLTDSVNKELTITTEDPVLEDLNYYTGDILGGKNTRVAWAPESVAAVVLHSEESGTTSFKDCVEWSSLVAHDYIVVSLQLKVTGTITTDSGMWYVNYMDTDGNAESISIFNDDITNYASVRQLVFAFAKPADFDYITTIEFHFNPLTTVPDLVIEEAEVQVNFTDHAGYIPDYHKPYSALGWVLDNDNLLYEDFTLTESLCSQDNLKFGLCEAAQCEFSEVGIDNVKVGQKIRPALSLPDYAGGITDNDIFAINWINSAQAGQSSGISGDFNAWKQLITFTQYWASWSSYIDSLGLREKNYYCDWQIKLNFSNLSGAKPSYFTIGYYIAKEDGTNLFLKPQIFYDVSDYDGVFGHVTISDPITQSIGTCVGIKTVYALFYDENKEPYAAGDLTGGVDTWCEYIQYRVGDSGHTMPVYSTDDCYIAKGKLYTYLKSFDDPSRIPLGEFAIASVTNEYKHNVIKKKVTAYDDLVKLENNAADWYTRYMFGVDTDSWTGNGFEYARQIFSSYWSYVSDIGLDSVDNYNLTTVATFTDTDYKVTDSTKYKALSYSYQGNNKAINYGAQTVNISDTSLYYRVTYGNFGNYTDAQIMSSYFYGYGESVDALLRGFGTNGGVLIEEYKTGSNTPYNCLCVNRGDFFTLSSETASIKVVLPSGSKGYNISLVKDIVVESAVPRQSLTNGNLRLCYYNFGTKDIFACESSITGRDVVRSLLEVCGCFFRLDRLNGLPEFVYPTKGGLYPSNTLYPADDLYPRHGTDQIYPMGRYISVRAENYTVKDYGRIQILKNIKSSDTKSVVEWQYEGDPDAENTYIIDDNIFYCAEEMEYDYGNMPEVSDMLAGMWSRINNMGYVPNITQALGAPWLECGDRVGLLTFDGGFETFIFRRTLKGIQNLRDTYESEGDELNTAIDDFGYAIYSV